MIKMRFGVFAFILVVHSMAMASEVTFTHVGCTDAELFNIAIAESEMPVMLDRATEYTHQMMGMNRDSYNYFYWFGGWISKNVYNVRLDVDHVNNQVNGRDVVIDCHANLGCDADTYAWTTFDGPPVIHLCDLFWDLPATLIVAYPTGRLNVMMHELFHNVLGIADVVTSLEEARYLVLKGTINNPLPWEVATRSAYNFEGYYLSSYIMARGGGCHVVGKEDVMSGLFIFVGFFVFGWIGGRIYRKIKMGMKRRT